MNLYLYGATLIKLQKDIGCSYTLYKLWYLADHLHTFTSLSLISKLIALAICSNESIAIKYNQV